MEGAGEKCSEMFKHFNLKERHHMEDLGTVKMPFQGRRNRFSKPASKQMASSTDYTASYSRR
jgi:hypothetical protein